MSSSQHDKIKRITGNAPWSVLFCQQCLPATLPNVEDVRAHHEYEWALTLTCPRCASQWNICKICSQMRKPLLDATAMYQHYYKKHKDNNKKQRSDASCNEMSIDDKYFPIIMDEVFPSTLERSLLLKKKKNPWTSYL
jgi:hypothetical protein